jgi:hypothetical protein
MLFMTDAKPVELSPRRPAYQHYATVIPTDRTAAWLVPSLKRLVELRGRPADWDGYGSPAVTADAIGAANEILESLSRYPLPKPEIFPVSGGGIGIVFSKDGRELQIELLPSGAPEFMKDSASLANRHESEIAGVVTSGGVGSCDALAFWLLGF